MANDEDRVSFIGALANFADNGFSVEVTVQVSGLLITGRTIRTADWFKAFIKKFQDEADLFLPEEPEQVKRMTDAIRILVDVQEAAARAEPPLGRPEYLYLRDVSIRGGLPFAPVSLPVWCALIDRVDGWMLGSPPVEGGSNEKPARARPRRR